MTDLTNQNGVLDVSNVPGIQPDSYEGMLANLGPSDYFDERLIAQYESEGIPSA